MYRKNAAKPTSGNSHVLRVIFGFADSEYTIKLMHPTINRREDAVSSIICFVHFHRAKPKQLALEKKILIY
jgi:hypothetical protein